MSVLEVPTTADFADFVEQVALDDEVFTLRFRFNERMQSWFVDVSDSVGAPLAMGRRLLVDLPLGIQHHHRAIFKGEMLAFDSSLRKLDPALPDLGERVVVLYLDAARLDALRASG